tara:strand:+ start:143 stop:358 length:216 start_codon:yes stop_codon:yes gene_type:complete
MINTSWFICLNSWIKYVGRGYPYFEKMGMSAVPTSDSALVFFAEVSSLSSGQMALRRNSFPTDGRLPRQEL